MIYDLIYKRKKYLDVLKKLFPNAVFEDDSDEAHEDRIFISVDIEKKRILENNYFKWFFVWKKNIQNI